MPVVTVLAAPHRDTRGLLSVVADAVADTLGLGEGDVIATFDASGETVQSGTAGPVPHWPVVTVQGSAREQSMMEAARSSAEAAVRAWAVDHEVAIGGVWTQWLVPVPLAP